MRFFGVVLLAAPLLAGCASYDGSSLVAGTATAADVEALMGRPAERMTKPDGGSVLYFPRGPAGRDSYAVLLGADGRLQAIEQRLTDANLAKIALGSTTARQVRELLGPPPTTSYLTRIPRDVWEYKMGDGSTPYILWVQFSTDGVVREVIKMKDPAEDANSGPGLP